MENLSIPQVSAAAGLSFIACLHRGSEQAGRLTCTWRKVRSLWQMGTKPRVLPTQPLQEVTAWGVRPGFFLFKRVAGARRVQALIRATGAR